MPQANKKQIYEELERLLTLVHSKWVDIRIEYSGHGAKNGFWAIGEDWKGNLDI